MDSELIFKLESKLIPFPKKLFSWMPNEVEAPEVPIPAPAEIWPVGFSSTVISIVFSNSLSVSTSWASTVLNILVDLILFIDFWNKILLKGSWIMFH